MAENYVLGQGSPLRPLWRTTDVAGRIAELSRRYGLEVRPDAFVRDLSVGERQRVEILRILFQGAELIVLDEPTAVLTPGETDRLLKLLRELARDRKTVIFISHKLDEVMRVSDRVSVMRDGRVVFSASTRDTNPRELARQMVGRDVPTDLPARAASPGQVVFSVENLHCRNDLGLPAVRGVSFVSSPGRDRRSCGRFGKRPERAREGAGGPHSRNRGDDQTQRRRDFRALLSRHQSKTDRAYS